MFVLYILKNKNCIFLFLNDINTNKEHNKALIKNQRFSGYSSLIKVYDRHM